MSRREMESFLSENNLARVATVKPDGSPHVTPVWYLWEDNVLLIAILKGSVKDRNIRRNNRVCVTIDTDAAPTRGVIIEGTASLEELDEETERKICARYLHPEEVDEYLEYAHSTFQSVLAKIRPIKIITWDYSKNPSLNKLQG